jgi:hypothetical protein
MTRRAFDADYLVRTFAGAPTHVRLDRDEAASRSRASQVAALLGGVPGVRNRSGAGTASKTKPSARRRSKRRAR